MGRPGKGYWKKRKGAYFTDIGGTTRRLEYPDGSPVRKGDDAGRLEALARISGGRAPGAGAGPGPTVREVLEAYIAWHRARGSKPDTINGHRHILTAWGRHRGRGGAPLREKLAANVAAEDWSSYRRTLAAKGLAPRTIEAHLDSIKACWRWAARPVDGRVPSRLVRQDPFRELLVDMKPERRRVFRALSHAQVAGVVEAARARGPRAFGVAVAIQADSGCRTAEVLSLRWAWWTGRSFVVPPSEHKTGARTGRARVVAVTAATAARLEAWRSDPLCSPVWVVSASRSGTGKRPASASWYSEWWRKAVVGLVAGLPATALPYDLRASFVAHARRAGVDRRESAGAAGHSPEVAARFYDSISEDDAIRAVERAAGGRQSRQSSSSGEGGDGQTDGTVTDSM